MMSDREILAAIDAGEIEIDPFNANQLQPASYDLLLGDSVQIVNERDLVAGFYGAKVFDITTDVTSWHEFSLPRAVHKNDFVLGSTFERIRLGPGIAMQLTGKSTVGRHGLTVHITAGHVDPGWDGDLTLEIANLGPFGLMLTPRMPIAQAVFFRLGKPCDHPYAGQYQGQRGPRAPGLLKRYL